MLRMNRFTLTLLTLLILLSAPPVQAAPPLRSRLLGAAEVVQGSIDRADQRDRYLFVAQYGASLTIGAFPLPDSLVSPIVELYAPNGDKLSEAALSTERPQVRGAYLTGVSAPQTGAYVIEVRTASGTGQYELSVSDSGVLREVNAGTLALDTAVPGSLNRMGDRDQWVLNLTQGAQVSIEAQGFGSAVRPLLTVIAPDGTPVTPTPAYGSVIAAPTATPVLPTVQIAFTASVTGSYRVRIGAQPDSNPAALAGNYLITVLAVNNPGQSATP